MDLSGKRALVTGAGRGIGRLIALRFAEAGADVAVTARTEKEIEAVAREIGDRDRKSFAFAGDISNQDDVSRVANGAIEALGGIDILVNNAAAIARGGVLDVTVEEWDRVMATNLRGVFLMTRSILPAMMEKGEGTIVMVSSTAGKRGDPGWSAYSASKFGLMGLAHSLLYEVRRKGVRVIVVSPSAVDTRPMEPGSAPEGGRGAPLRAEDVAESVLAAATLPPRAMIREVEIWATNP